MKITHILASLLVLLSCALADDDKQDEKRPVLIVVADGFPAGNATPEGAACDLARAFIECDPELFRNTCIEPFGGGENRPAYEEFLTNVAASMTAEAEKETPSPGGPKRITKLFAARHLSMSGPVSAAYAMHDFRDIMFVDLEVELFSGRTAKNRTMVIKKKDGTWYVHPAPHTASLLSMGLNDEEPSTADFTAVYDVQKK